MLMRRVVVIAFLCAILLVSPMTSQTQSSGPRADLGPQVTEPHPDYGTLNGKRYVNGYFGFSYAFPEGWNGNAIQTPGTSLTALYALFTANPSSSGGSDLRYVTISADSLGGKNCTPKNFIDATVSTFGSGFDVLSTDKHYTFAGKQFYRIDLVSKPAPGSPTMYQTQVFTLTPSYAISFSFLGANTKDIEALVQTLQSIDFNLPAAAPAVHSAAVSQPKTK